jgi:hypothetical protein
MSSPSTGHEHHHHDQQRGHDQGNAEHRGDAEHQIGREQDQVAMREIDQPHDAEDQRQPQRKQRIDAAKQHALDHGVQSDHRGLMFRNKPSERHPGWHRPAGP